ncbi:MAG TPA: FUSC family protein [Actinocrinis sp.]|nr:FUSC family protein [Actinocrinis sp.]
MATFHSDQARQAVTHPVQWLGTHDRGLLALRRAGRAAIVMPAMFAFGAKVLDNGQLATFAAFGAFAMLLLVDFSGTRWDRARALGSLTVVGSVLVSLGTLASREAWSAAVAMCVVGFAVLFVGVVSSVTAGATTSLLLSFILPVSLPGSPSAIADRVEGWVMAGVVAMAAATLLWPAPAEDRLRARAWETCLALAERLRAEATFVLSGRDGEGDGSSVSGIGDSGGSLSADTGSNSDTAAASSARAAYDAAVAKADSAVADLHKLFLATPYRPTGLSMSARATVRLVDELNWLNAVLVESRPIAGATVDRVACAVRSSAATALECGADLLKSPLSDPEPLHTALTRLQSALVALEGGATNAFPIRPARPDEDGATMVEERVEEFIDSLDPGFRAQELCFVVNAIGRNIDLAAGAERRTWFERLLGRRPRNEGAGLPGTLSAAQERAAAHVERHSVWLHNSVRGGIGLGAAVLVANLTGVQHSFWVVLGTLSVLRSNALNTGQNALRAVVGTAVGFAIGALLLIPIGTNTTLLWFLLPPAILLAGIAPAAISFAAGQAGFTLVLVILFNIIQPSGWRVGLVRVEDIALGCAISLVVGLLLWPRGAAAALSKALSEAYADSARYLAAAVEFGVRRCDGGGGPDPVAPTREAVRAAAASRRMDDTFRGFLAERGAKTLPLAEVTRLVTGVAGLRLAADAVLDLWERDGDRAPGDRTAARAELIRNSESITGWYDELAESLDGLRPVPAPLDRDLEADDRLLYAVQHDLRAEDGRASAAAVRMIWTGDHLDAARRLQASLIQPALVAGRRAAAARA